MTNLFEYKAVDAVASALADPTFGLAVQLAALRAALTLTEAELPDPAAIEPASMPDDTRSPLVVVYDLAAEPMNAGHRHHLAGVDLTVGVVYNGDARVTVGERVVRLYLAAIRNVLDASPTCGGRVSQAWWTDANRDLEVTFKSITRHARALGVMVRVHDPS